MRGFTQTYRILATLCALSVGAYAHARTPHRLAQPLSVQADSIQIDERTGLSLYQGHVRLVQDGLTIHAKKVRVRSAHGQVLSIRAYGNPMHMEDQKTGGLPVFGEAQTLHFVAASDEVTLTSHVVFRQGVNVLHGHIIHYYVRAQRMTAIRGAHSRVRARITPHTHKPKAHP
ncbi:MAG: lipopolysaccharide transport periplasmic protein LptA [Acidiferrobacter sp.]